MGAFELQDTVYAPAEHTDGPIESHERDSKKKVKDECIVAYKVYDSCRRQNCLTPAELGPARAAGTCSIGEFAHKEGDIIKPPTEAASVTMDKLKIRKIQVVDKQPSPFRTGYWDVDVKYVFEYRLTFREAGGCTIGFADANSFFHMKTTLFGSIGSDLVIGTDLYQEATTFEAAPFIWVEAKAVGLDAKLSHHHHGHCGEVLVTIGLFSILKLFRLVHLNVQSTGFCVPEECEDTSDINPCEYFSELDFPMDIFAPPQRREYLAGISENISKKPKI